MTDLFFPTLIGGPKDGHRIDPAHARQPTLAVAVGRLAWLEPTAPIEALAAQMATYFRGRLACGDDPNTILWFFYHSELTTTDATKILWKKLLRECRPMTDE